MMRHFAIVIATVVLSSAFAAQDRSPKPKVKCSFDKHISCICSWEFEDRPHTSARGYFLTREFWNRVEKTCWSDLVQFTCTERPVKGNHVDASRVTSPVLPAALEQARKLGKPVFFIGLTGG